jgi:hypothetical protein
MTVKNNIAAAAINVLTMPLPYGSTEADRRETLARMCFMVTIKLGDNAWPEIWSEVMAKTGCKSWRETMNKGKH